MNDSLLSLMSLCVYIYVIAIVNSILKLLQVITAQEHLLVLLLLFFSGTCYYKVNAAYWREEKNKGREGTKKADQGGRKDPYSTPQYICIFHIIRTDDYKRSKRRYGKKEMKEE